MLAKTEPIPAKMSDETQTAKPDNDMEQSVGANIEVLSKTLPKKDQTNFTTCSR